jgi:hypothetical protein
LEDEGPVPLDDAGFPLEALDACACFDRAGTLLLADRFAVRGDLRGVFEDLDFGLRVAM